GKLRGIATCRCCLRRRGCESGYREFTDAPPRSAHTRGDSRRGMCAARTGGTMLRAILLLMLLTGAGQASAQAPSAAHADEVAAAMTLPDGLRQALDARRADRALPMREQVQGLLDYMIADDGLALRYQEQPTLGIADSYAQRRVNCLSFTLLFVAMARASGMRARVQASDDALAMEVLGDTIHRTSH